MLCTPECAHISGNLQLICPCCMWTIFMDSRSQTVHSTNIRHCIVFNSFRKLRGGHTFIGCVNQVSGIMETMQMDVESINCKFMGSLSWCFDSASTLLVGCFEFPHVPNNLHFLLTRRWCLACTALKRSGNQPCTVVHGTFASIVKKEDVRHETSIHGCTVQPCWQRPSLSLLERVHNKTWNRHQSRQ